MANGAAPAVAQPGSAASGASPARLAFTGGNWFELVAIGIGLAAGGLFLTVLSRPRRKVGMTV